MGRLKGSRLLEHALEGSVLSPVPSSVSLLSDSHEVNSFSTTPSPHDVQPHPKPTGMDPSDHELNPLKL